MRSSTSQSSSAADADALAELLSVDDGEFVNMAYERLLGRSPADAEQELWLAPLRDGSRSKLDVLAGIRFSAEGRAHAAAVPGLRPPRELGWWQRLPIVGYAVRWMQQLATLPRLARRLDSLQAELAAEAAMRHRDLSLIDEAKADRLLVDARMEAIDEAKADRLLVDARIEAIDEAKADRLAVDARMEALWAWVTPVGRSMRAPAADRGAATNAFNDYYRRFEEQFRGSADAIRARLQFYVPMFRAVTHPGPADSPARFVDLGCGRGELIELLREQGLDAYGVESSEVMVARCRGNGLTVLHGDALEHLESLAPESLAGIASIHVIEHLPFLQLAALFGQAFRVLRPGGVAIFETPNPENLIVGACNFYYDPTHLRPLPPEPMHFLLEASGFARVAIERLHPGGTMAQVDAASDPIAKMYATMMLVPQDYALIAYKT